MLYTDLAKPVYQSALKWWRLNRSLTEKKYDITEPLMHTLLLRREEMLHLHQLQHQLNQQKSSEETQEDSNRELEYRNQIEQK